MLLLNIEFLTLSTQPVERCRLWPFRRTYTMSKKLKISENGPTIFGFQIPAVGELRSE